MQNQNNLPDLGVGPASVQEPQLSTPSPPRAFTKFNDLPFEIRTHLLRLLIIPQNVVTQVTQVNGYMCHVKSGNGLTPLSMKLSSFLKISIRILKKNHRRLKLYEETFRSKPTEFYSRSAQRIFTDNSFEYLNSDFELELLQVCDCLVGLECWSVVREELTIILKIKNWPKLKALCINVDLLPGDENTFRLPIFKYVTHLDFNSEKPQLPSWENLNFLDNLTHMRVYMLA